MVIILHLNLYASSGGNSKGAGSIYVTGNTSASEAIMKFAVGHNVDRAYTKYGIMGNGEVGIGTDNLTELTIYGDEPNIRLTHTGQIHKRFICMLMELV